MSRRMSCSMTIDAVKERRKTVTRRRVDTWKNLRPGDRLILIEKGMGLPKGAKQVVLAEVEVVDVSVENLHEGIFDRDVDPEVEVEREGLDLTPEEFFRFWLDSHGFGRIDHYAEIRVECRRIEWRYLDEAVTG